MLSRVNDVANEHGRLNLPIDGYENFRLVSLEEALIPVNHLFNQVSLQERVSICKARCDAPADGLSVDESASIALYTAEWPPSEQSLYSILNDTLRSENRDALKPWFSYLRLFIGALLQLPPANDMIFRGVKQNLIDAYPLDSTSIWWGISSCTENISVMETERFCGLNGARTMFHIQPLEGRSIRNHSFYPTEEEVLMLPGRSLKVKGRYSTPDGLNIIQLREVKPDYTLLKLPDTGLWRRIIPGISLLGKCSNASCVAYQKEVIIPIGFRKLDVLQDTDETISQCPMCHKYVDVSKLGFCQCQWRDEGIKQTTAEKAPARFSKDWSRADGCSLVQYKSEEGTIWRKLIIEAKPYNSN